MSGRSAVSRYAIAILCPLLLSAADPVIARYDGVTLRGGKFGYLAEVQKALNQLPLACRPTQQLSTDGQFGPGMRTAIVKATACPSFRNLAADSAARQGALTEAFWSVLFPGRDKPSVHERAMAIVLTQEATDYDVAEWNICQSRPAYNPTQGQPVCFSNDPHSFLTWGPRGATAGNGAEIQQIVFAIDSDPSTKAILDSSFGSTASLVRRLTRLNASDTERFLCTAWLDPQSRQDWKSGFALFGASPQVIRVYETVYASSAYDGGKIAQFYRLYQQAGITPSEVDYAFMVDRATQSSAPSKQIMVAAQAAMANAGANATPAALRRWLALNFRPAPQSADRLGRDVVFYVDAFEQNLSLEEQSAWKKRNPIRSSDAGLTDSVPLANFQAPKLAYQAPPRGSESLTQAERAACPAAVLNPKAPGATH